VRTLVGVNGRGEGKEGKERWNLERDKELTNRIQCEVHLLSIGQLS